MAAERIVSADSHVVEPADVWTARIEPRFADRAPHVIKKEGRGEGDYFVCENLPPTSVKGFALAGVIQGIFSGGEDGICGGAARRMGPVGADQGPGTGRGGG